jgi:hypothetical protein
MLEIGVDNLKKGWMMIEKMIKSDGKLDTVYKEGLITQ